MLVSHVLKNVFLLSGEVATTRLICISAPGRWPRAASLWSQQQPKAAGGGFNRNDGDVTPRPKLSKEVLRTLNSAKGILMSVDSLATPPNRNLHKKYLMVPRSLPSKLVMDVQRERWQVRTCSY